MNYRYCPYCLTPMTPGQPCGHCGKAPDAYVPEPHHYPAGQLLAQRYYIGKTLGEGGFGITYLGLDTKLMRRVAIKEYFPRTLVRRDAAMTRNVTCYTGSVDIFEKGRAQFLREAQTLAKLDDIPEIVRVLDFFAENNSAYIVMEFLEGETLKEMLMRRGPLPAGELFAMLEPVLKGMDAMHGEGLIHRDISPDNLMVLQKSGRVKLMDFGCAREMGVGHTMTIMLKPGFAPAEQYTGHEQGPWTDVYALSATIYYCLTGKIPPESMRRMGGERLTPPSALGSDISWAQEQALLRGMAVFAQDRLQSVRELYDGLYGAGGYPHSTVEAGGAAYGQTEYFGTHTVRETPAADPVPQSTADGHTEYVASVVTAQQTAPTGGHTEYAAPVVTAQQTVPTAGHTEYAAPAVTAQQTAPTGGHTEYVAPVVTAQQGASALGHTEYVDPGAADIGHTAYVGATGGQPPRDPEKKKKWLIPAIVAGVLALAFCIFWFAHPHSYGDWETVEEATCLADGLRQRKCFCGKAESETLESGGHTAVKDSAVKATCVQTGLTEGSHCSVCGTVLAEQAVLKMTDHKIVTVDSVAPTCVQTGLTAGSSCSECGYVFVEQETVPLTDHTPVADPAVSATCSKEGRTEGSHCSVCGEILDEPETVPKTEHKSEKDKAVAATCSATGLTEGSHCSVCGEVLKKQEATPKTNHKSVTDKAVAATCSATGLTEGSHCSSCGQVLKKQEATAKSDHTPETVPAVEVSCDQDGLSEGVKCSVCGYEIQKQKVTAKATGHKFEGTSCVYCDEIKWYVEMTITPDHYETSPGSSQLIVYIYYRIDGYDAQDTETFEIWAYISDYSDYVVLQNKSVGDSGSLEMALDEWEGLTLYLLAYASDDELVGASYETF